MLTRTLALASTLVVVSACSAGDQTPETTGSTADAMKVVCGASAGGPVQGRDVSVYQGNFDWNAQKAQGVVFGYARISDGTTHYDSQFSNNWNKMKAAGILRGAYQFFEPAQDPVAQANMVVAAIGKLGVGDLPAMIDVEATGGQSGATIAARIQIWMDVVEKGTGRHPLIYSGSYFWEDNVGSTAFGATPFWIAAYGPACPSVPNGWSNWKFWQYSNGNGSLDHDVFNGTLAELQAMARPADQAPRGYLDVADCASIGGWAQDQDTPTKAVNVDLYFDGPAGSSAPGVRTLANQSRADLCTPLGSCEHGFALKTPASLFDGKPHTVHAYGIDSNPIGDNPLLADAPKSFNCALPALPKNVLRRHVTDQASFSAWKFNMFEGVFHYPQAQVNTLPIGRALTAAPTLVVADGDPGIYVRDGKLKRHVINPASMTAWSFDGLALKKLTLAQLQAMPNGAEWPAAPTLIQGSGGPEVDVLDVADGAAEDAPTSPALPAAPAVQADASGASGDSGGCSAAGTSNSGAASWLLSLAVVAMLRRRKA